MQKGIYLKDRLGRWAEAHPTRIGLKDEYIFVGWVPKGNAPGVQLPTFFVIIPKLKNFGKIAAFSRYNTEKDMCERGEP